MKFIPSSKLTISYSDNFFFWITVRISLTNKKSGFFNSSSFPSSATFSIKSYFSFSEISFVAHFPYSHDRTQSIYFPFLFVSPFILFWKPKIPQFLYYLHNLNLIKNNLLLSSSLEILQKLYSFWEILFQKAFLLYVVYLTLLDFYL